MPETNLQTKALKLAVDIIEDLDNPCQYCIYRNKKCFTDRSINCKEGIYKWLVSNAEEEE